MKARTPGSRQQGAALLLVVWVVALLSLLAATALQIASASAHAALAAQERARSAAAADGAINLALLQMIDPDPKSRRVVAGQTWILEVGGYKVLVTSRDEAGKVDVNRASDATLRAIAQSAGASSRDVDLWVKSVKSYRSDKLKVELSGSLSSTPSERMFRSVDEIAVLTDIPASIFHCMRPGMTVYTGQENVDLRNAGEFIRRAVAKIQYSSGGSPERDALNATESSSSLAGRILALQATASGEQGRFARSAVIRLSGDAEYPTLVSYWGNDSDENQVGDCEAPK